MGIRDLIPRRKGDVAAPPRAELDVLDQFHRDIDRLFAGFFDDLGFGLPARWEALGAGADWPRVNVAESDQEVVVSAELPGVDEKQVQVELEDDTLTLRGEVCEAREEKGRRWARVERRCGSFRRTVPLPAEVVADQAKAAFARGVLTVTLPKRAPAEGRRRTVVVES